MVSWPPRMVTRCEICGQGPSRWHADRENPDHHSRCCCSTLMAALICCRDRLFLSDASCTYTVIGAADAVAKHKPLHG